MGMCSMSHPPTPIVLKGQCEYQRNMNPISHHSSSAGLLVRVGELKHESEHVWLSGYFSVAKRCFLSIGAYSMEKALSAVCGVPFCVNILDTKGNVVSNSISVANQGGFWHCDLRSLVPSDTIFGHRRFASFVPSPL